MLVDVGFLIHCTDHRLGGDLFGLTLLPAGKNLGITAQISWTYHEGIPMARVSRTGLNQRVGPVFPFNVLCQRLILNEEFTKSSFILCLYDWFGQELAIRLEMRSGQALVVTCEIAHETNSDPEVYLRLSSLDFVSCALGETTIEAVAGLTGQLSGSVSALLFWAGVFDLLFRGSADLDDDTVLWGRLLRLYKAAPLKPGHRLEDTDFGGEVGPPSESDIQKVWYALGGEKEIIVLDFPNVSLWTVDLPFARGWLQRLDLDVLEAVELDMDAEQFAQGTLALDKFVGETFDDCWRAASKMVWASL